MPVGLGKLRKGKPFVYPNGARSERDGDEQRKLKQAKPNTPPDAAMCSKNATTRVGTRLSTSVPKFYLDGILYTDGKI